MDKIPDDSITCDEQECADASPTYSTSEQGTGLYVDVENLQDDVDAILEALIANWSQIGRPDEVGYLDRSCRSSVWLMYTFYERLS